MSTEPLQASIEALRAEIINMRHQQTVDGTAIMELRDWLGKLSVKIDLLDKQLERLEDRHVGNPDH